MLNVFIPKLFDFLFLLGGARIVHGLPLLGASLVAHLDLEFLLDFSGDNVPGRDFVAISTSGVLEILSHLN